MRGTDVNIDKCRCGFYMPAPAHAKECGFYDEWKERYSREMAKSAAEAKKALQEELGSFDKAVALFNRGLSEILSQVAQHQSPANKGTLMRIANDMIQYGDAIHTTLDPQPKDPVTNNAQLREDISKLEDQFLPVGKDMEQDMGADRG